MILIMWMMNQIQYSAKQSIIILDDLNHFLMAHRSARLNDFVSCNDCRQCECSLYPEPTVAVASCTADAVQSLSKMLRYLLVSR